MLPISRTMNLRGLRCARWVALAGLLGTGALRAEAAGAPASSAPEVPAASASANPQGASLEAGQWMREGVTLFGRGQWEASRRAFLEAWKRKQHHAVAANLAEVEVKLGLWRDAAEHLKFALAHLPAGRSEDRSVAETQLEECRKHLGSVMVQANVDGATVEVDGQPIGHLPVREPLLLDPGRHTLRLERAGYGPEQAELEVTAGQRTTVELELRALPSVTRAPPPASVTSPPPAPPPPPESGSATRTWILVGGGVFTLAAVGLGVGFTLDSDASRHAARRDGRAVDGLARTAGLVDTSGACVAPPSGWAAPCAALKSHLEESTSSRRVANASFITAGVLGAATVTTVLLLPVRRDQGSRPGLHAVVGAGAVGLSGTF
jgi:hypothetical protein